MLWSRCRPVAVMALVTAISVVGAILPQRVQASPRDAAVDRARAVKAQVDRLDRQAEIAAEEHNAANETYTALGRKRKSLTRDLEKVQGRVDGLQRDLNSRVDVMYRQGQASGMEVLLGARSFTELEARWAFLRLLGERDARTVSELRTARARMAKRERELKRAEASARVARATMAQRRKTIEARLAARQQVLRGVETEVAALERAEEAAARARAAAAVRTNPRFGRTFPRPTRAARSEVVSIAKRYLGAPYRWGATGPDSFDCSGFTQFVYRQVGVRLPRVSRDQISAGQRVSRGDLLPGDLVFFGSPIHHVGIYVGGGLMIHSPRTGDVVKISPLHGDYVGAARP